MDQENDSEGRDAAARTIQKAWASKSNQVKQKYMSGDRRWIDAATHAQLHVERDAADRGANSPKERFKRTAFYVGRLQDADAFLQHSGDEHPDAKMKVLETQHWLELVDAKHRYGSNLKFYHRVWQESDTKENFFKWLDKGDGKDVSLEECSREQLEKERIVYLSTEQRLNYLVEIDKDGKFVWAKNKQLVDTSAGRWKDDGTGDGIVPDDNPSVNEVRPGPNHRDSFASSKSDIAAHYSGDSTSHNRVSKLWRSYFTLRGAMDKLLKRTIRRNTWIYVADKNFNMFVGIKKTGEFQHSSFLAGGIATSAGLLSIKDGVIRTISPLSGHYRTSISHFHQFVDILHEKGADLSKLQISRAEAALWGIEHLGKVQKKKKNAIDTVKGKTREAASDVLHKVEPILPEGKWKREVVEGRNTEVQKTGEG